MERHVVILNLITLLCLNWQKYRHYLLKMSLFETALIRHNISIIANPERLKVGSFTLHAGKIEHLQ